MTFNASIFVKDGPNSYNFWVVRDLACAPPLGYVLSVDSETPEGATTFKRLRVKEATLSLSRARREGEFHGLNLYCEEA